MAALISRCPPSQSATLSPLATASPPMALISSTTCCAGVTIAAGAVGGAAEVVDHDLGALRGEQQRVLAADAATGTGDDGDATVERTHGTPLVGWRWWRHATGTGPANARGDELGQDVQAITISTAVPRFTTAVGPGFVASTLPSIGPADRRPGPARPAVSVGHGGGQVQADRRSGTVTTSGPFDTATFTTEPRGTSRAGRGSSSATSPAGGDVSLNTSARADWHQPELLELGRGLRRGTGRRASGRSGAAGPARPRGRPSVPFGDLGAGREGLAAHRPGHDDGGRGRLVELRADRARCARPASVSSWPGRRLVLAGEVGELRREGALGHVRARWARPARGCRSSAPARRRRRRARCRSGRSVCSTFQSYCETMLRALAISTPTRGGTG